MMYVDFEVGNSTYKLRLNTRATVALEKRLGCNPLSIFGNGDTIPTITTMVTILHASLQQYHHNIGLDEAYDIFDTWLEENHVMTDFLAVLVEIFKASGLMKDNKKEGEGKNA
jgi:hypothetical protein